MELWIRSQNKDGLAKIHSISIEEKTSTKFSIVGNSEWILGIYETEERALEVLDEIQKKLNARKGSECSVEYILIDNIALVIYEMPKE